MNTAEPLLAGRSSLGPLLLLLVLLLLVGGALGCHDLLLPYLAQLYSLRPPELLPWYRAYWVSSLLVALPAGWAVARLGYGRGLAGGLLVLVGGVLGLGAAAGGWGFGLAVAALGLLGAGGTLVRVAALPALTTLGPARQAAARLTLAGAAQALGSLLVPLLSGLLVGGNLGVGQLRGPYLGLTAGLLAGGALVGWGPLAVKKETAVSPPDTAGPTSAWGFRHLRRGVLAVLVGAGVQTGLGTFFIPFGESLQLTHVSSFTVARLNDLTEGFNFLLQAIGQLAAPPFAVGTGFTVMVGAAFQFAYQLSGLVGQLVGGLLLVLVPGRLVLAGAAAAGAGLVVAALALVSAGDAALWLLVASGLATALLWPVTVALALRGLGRFAAQGAGLLVLAATVGAGVALPLLSWLVGQGGWWVAFGALAAGALYLLYYALRGSHPPPSGQPT